MPRRDGIRSNRYDLDFNYTNREHRAVSRSNINMLIATAAIAAFDSFASKFTCAKFLIRLAEFAAFRETIDKGLPQNARLH